MRRAHRQPITWQQVFVVGAPRSGTTVLHALICSAPDVNDYVAECSYFTNLIKPLLHAWLHFDVHAHAYFSDRNELAHYHSELLASVLFDTWVQLGRPQTLALKDPMLTPHVSTLAALLPTTRFVVAARDPRAVVASRLAVMARQGEETGNVPVATQIAQEYNQYYEPVLRLRNQRPDAALVVPYAALVSDAATATIADFLSIQPRTSHLWEGWIATDATRRDPTFSQDYGRPLSSESVEKWRQQLTADQARAVAATSGPVAAALGIALA